MQLGEFGSKKVEAKFSWRYIAKKRIEYFSAGI